MEDDELVKKFEVVDKSKYPDFYSLEKILEKVLWVLYVAETELGIKKLNAKEIAIIITKALRIPTTSLSIINSIKRIKTSMIYFENGYYMIMKEGIDYINSKKKVSKEVLSKSNDSIEVFHFKPETKYSSKRVLYNEVLKNLKGELRIVDPYCGLRTLDILKELGTIPIKFLTNTQYLSNRRSFIRELNDFLSENSKAEFRDIYSNDIIHDRYIISSNSLVIIGQSIKDLGKKESFLISLDKKNFIDFYKTIKTNFKTKWDRSNQIV
ncbi:MAG: hypothetical protein JW984_12340 [Deltaproteobacteria bacterium]|uniref:Uncharacterized protein n=1 Tax=Candidatus Zymogenus saltonus TaxID=2844893 RepID=A0A9D8PNI4_9DELT|nr:hypothetical protein [Candidatus Zymogenus saltonus]